uniref:Protein phosphatase inhibitor 2 n=1 Tax=Lygus hesperus TaxID=30085 RepID=A0A146MD72_LYGHE
MFEVMDKNKHSGNSLDPKENLKRQPKKGILKPSASFEVEGQKSCPSKPCRPSGSKAMKFDEMNILETLHPPGKDYGHMKIDEPNTPYEKAMPDETDTVDADELTKRLEMGKDKVPKAMQVSSSSEEEEEESEEDREKRKQFVMKRKAHYNEFLAAKQALQALDDEDEEEE